MRLSNQDTPRPLYQSARPALPRAENSTVLARLPALCNGPVTRWLCVQRHQITRCKPDIYQRMDPFRLHSLAPVSEVLVAFASTLSNKPLSCLAPYPSRAKGGSL